MKSKDRDSIEKNLGQDQDFSFLAEMDDEILGFGPDSDDEEGDEDDEFYTGGDDEEGEEDFDIDLDTFESDIEAEAEEEINGEADIIDIALENLIDLLIDAEYEDESAEEAVFDALATLVNEGALADTPDTEDADEDKAQWVFIAVPLIKARLIELGLEFDETEG